MKKVIISLVISLLVGSATAQTMKFHFTFDDKLTDESANAYTLAPGASTTINYVTGRYGKAVELNGTSDYFDLLTQSILNPSLTSYTVCAWVYNTGLSSQWVMSSGFDEEQIVHQLNGVTVPDSRGRIFLHHIINSTNSTIQTVVGNNAQRADDNSFTVGVWQHVAVVSDPATKNHKFYVNGLLVGDRTITTNFESCTGGFRFGAHKGGTSSFWHGKLDEIRLYEGMLSESQITTVMNNGSISTSLSSAKLESYFEVYPNPVKGIATISNMENVSKISLLSLDGRNLRVKQNSNSIDLSGLSSGNYIMKITAKDGSQGFKKIVVNN